MFCVGISLYISHNRIQIEVGGRYQRRPGWRARDRRRGTPEGRRRHCLSCSCMGKRRGGGVDAASPSAVMGVMAPALAVSAVSSILTMLSSIGSSSALTTGLTPPLLPPRSLPKGLSRELQYSHMHNCKIKCFVPLFRIQCDMK